MKVLVEVCVSSLAEAQAAARAGVDSVELCTWPDCGGVTPSYGLVNAVKEELGSRCGCSSAPRPVGSPTP
ncbi:MAG: hypothetical protein IPJ87_06335 [Flavobacteriales bacterium]|nr:hypothetical protein [Flavobacteriales bacterium]